MLAPQSANRLSSLAQDWERGGGSLANSRTKGGSPLANPEWEKVWLSHRPGKGIISGLDRQRQSGRGGGLIIASPPGG